MAWLRRFPCLHVNIAAGGNIAEGVELAYNTSVQKDMKAITPLYVLKQYATLATHTLTLAGASPLEVRKDHELKMGHPEQEPFGRCDQAHPQ